MAITHVQGKINGAASTTTVTTTLDAAATVGNLIVVGARAGSSQILNTPTDDKGHTYTPCMDQLQSSSQGCRMWYTVVTVSGMTQVTVTTPGSSAVTQLAVDEFSGCSTTSPLGSTSTGTGTGTSLSVTSFSPTAGSLVAAFMTAANSVTYTAGTNYTIGVQALQSGTEYNLSATTTETAPATRTGGGSISWIEVAAEFKATTAIAISATLTGAGSLSGSVTMSVPGTATLTGAGSLSASMALTVDGTATLSGVGSLAGDVTMSVPVTATITGAGTAAAAVTISVPASAAMSGAGAAAGDVTMTVPLSAVLAGSGSLSGTADGGGNVDVTATLTGLGTLSATLTVTVSPAVSLTGTGDLAADSAGITMTVPLSAVMSGSGNTGGSPTMTTDAGTATLTGLGTLRATVSAAAARGVLRLTDTLKAWLTTSHERTARISTTDEGDR